MIPAKAGLGVRILQTRFPETDALRQAVPVVGAWEQLQEEVGVALVERSQALGHDLDDALAFGSGGGSGNRVGGTYGMRIDFRWHRNATRCGTAAELGQERSQIVGHVAGRVVAVRGSLREGLEANPLQLLGDAVVNLPRRARFVYPDPLQNLGSAGTAKRPLRRQQFV